MKRNAAFVGSEQWRKRDVRVDTWTRGVSAPEVTRVIDVPSGITITNFIGAPLDELLTTLAHRVRMLT